MIMIAHQSEYVT